MLGRVFATLTKNMFGLRSLFKRFRESGCAAMMWFWFWSNVSWSLWSVTLGFKMADCKKVTEVLLIICSNMMEWLFVYKYIFQVYYRYEHLRVSSILQTFNKAYTVYFEKRWGLNTSLKLQLFSFSRSYAVLFLVKNLTSATSFCSCSPKHAPNLLFYKGQQQKTYKNCSDNYSTRSHYFHGTGNRLWAYIYAFAGGGEREVIIWYRYALRILHSNRCDAPFWIIFWV